MNMLGLSLTLWPTVGSSLPYVDYALACHFLKNHPEAEEASAALIGYLSLAAREGHLCVHIDEKNIFPPPHQLLESSCPQFEALLVQGSKQLPQDLFTDVSSKDLRTVPSSPVCRLGSLFYLQRYWQQESRVISHFYQIADRQPEIRLDSQSVEGALHILVSNGKLLLEQAQAIRLACSGSFTIIAGGPGTGKTYTAGELIKIFWSSIDDKQRKECKIALAAPTGKAAANLQKSLSRAVYELEGFPLIHAKTLHSLLGIRSSIPSEEPEKLNADLILIDESSMIDVHLMAHLLASIKQGARLILLGDPHQLPPVSAGMLFADLVLCPKVRSVMLSKCLRSELHSLLQFAEKVNQGDSQGALRQLSAQANGISRLALDEVPIRATYEKILDFSLPFFLEAYKGTPEQMLEAFGYFRILCPLRQGPFGVDALNELFVQRMMQNKKNEEWFVAPILLVSNDSRFDLSNGEVGVLVRRMPKDKKDDRIREGDYALFTSREGETRKLPALLLSKFEYAYCLSVHKSQGSEFDRVLLLMPEGSQRFGREVLYTAVTRARKQLDIWTSDAILQETISEKSHRLSGLSMRL